MKQWFDSIIRLYKELLKFILKVDNKHTMMAISASSIRVLINAANEEGIQREDIVTLTKEQGEYVLVYYSK